VDTTSQPTTTGRTGDRSRFSIFRRRDARRLTETGMMAHVPDAEMDAASGRLVEAGILDGLEITQLFRHGGNDGFSLVHVWFKPNFHLPRHSHDADCLYYVLSGQVIMGSQEIGAGEGFYVPAGQSYGYRAGPGGVEVLEFRHATSFDIRLAERPDVFEQIAGAVRKNRGGWAEERRRPSERLVSEEVR
jgi:mannose-6-phosphate isomerase-like protein (cupin superfamily)